MFLAILSNAISLQTTHQDTRGDWAPRLESRRALRSVRTYMNDTNANLYITPSCHLRSAHIENPPTTSSHHELRNHQANSFEDTSPMLSLTCC